MANKKTTVNDANDTVDVADKNYRDAADGTVVLEGADQPGYAGKDYTDRRDPRGEYSTAHAAAVADGKEPARHEDITRGTTGQPPAAGAVEMRVSTKGHQKIATGAFHPGTHVPKYYNKGDIFHAPDQEAADQLIDRGLADIP